MPTTIAAIKVVVLLFIILYIKIKMSASLFSYGFSIWAVPKNHEQIRSKYNMKHIPHVTLKTNLEKEDRTHNFSTCHIKFKKNFVWFPKMYSKDEKIKRASGYYCDVEGLPFEVRHMLHMSVWYDYSGPWSGENIPEEPPDNTMATIYSVDTRSPDPSEWQIINRPYLRGPD